MLKGRKSAARNPNFAGERKIKNQLAGIVPPKSPEKLWWKKTKNSRTVAGAGIFLAFCFPIFAATLR